MEKQLQMVDVETASKDSFKLIFNVSSSQNNLVHGTIKSAKVSITLKSKTCIFLIWLDAASNLLSSPVMNVNPAMN